MTRTKPCTQLRNPPARHFAKRQKGATLIVGLILLVLLTVMGVSSIESVNLQTNMARNSQFNIHAYQVALSEINAQLAALNTDMSSLNQAVINGSEAQTGDALQMQPDNFTQTVAFSYIGTGLPPTGYSVDTYIGRRFELDSRAQVSSTGIASDQTQGLNYAGPK